MGDLIKNIPKAIFYLLKDDCKLGLRVYRVSVGLEVCITKGKDGYKS